VRLQQGDTQAALEAYRAGFDIFRKLADADPRDARAQRDLAVSHEKVGDVRLRQNDTKAALEAYRASLDIHRKLADADKGNVEAQTDLFVSYWNLGSVEKSQFEFNKASDWFRKGRAVLEPLHQAGKLGGHFMKALSMVDREIAFCETAEKAVADLDFALKQPEALVPQLLGARIRVWHKNGKHAEVAATADKFHTLADLPGEPAGNNIYTAACGYALASTCADADDKTKQAHTAKAVALLKEARDKGFFKAKGAVEFAKKDADLDALRQRDDFKKLLAELEKDAK
jgi:tetratricopeptide (TPR) repeat protein